MFSGLRKKLESSPAASAFVRLPWRLRGKLVCRLVRDRRVPIVVRIGLPVLVLYLLSPIDIIPDFIPVLGYIDDAVAIALAMWIFSKLVPPEVVMGHANQLLKEQPASDGREEDGDIPMTGTPGLGVPGGGLGSLPMLSNARSRSISAKNMKGVRGLGLATDSRRRPAQVVVCRKQRRGNR